MGDPRIDRIAARQAAQTAATHLTVAPLMADTAKMSDEQVGKLTALFDVFDPDGHAYAVGVWESVIDANVWSPSAYPAGWKAV